MIRRIIKIGNSDGVIIPKQTLQALKLKNGDLVEVYISEPGGHLTQLELMRELSKLQTPTQNPTL
jgi:antitoxin component of MazEF toxin-antitoxin module